MARLAAALLAVLALAAPADAAQRSGSRATLGMPTGLKAFLLRASEQPGSAPGVGEPALPRVAKESSGIFRCSKT